MDLSVVVSSCNREADLARLLGSLDTVEVRPGCAWELVLVDNNSTDGTADIVREFSRRSRFPVRYVFEARQGKSYGLNAGLALARGRILAFTDDDAIVPPDWIQQIIDYFERDPAAVCVGGMVRRHDPRDAYVAIRESPDPARIDLSSFQFSDIQIIGCNLAMRAELARKVGEFDVDLCPGSPIGVADDVDMLYRILRAGHELHYAPHIWVNHNHGRRTPDQLARVLRSYTIGRGAFFCKYVLRGDRTVTRWAYWDACMLIRLLCRGKVRGGFRTMSLLLLGAVRYLRFRQRPGAGRARVAVAA